MISVNDIHWAAGFLEGEGTFGFYVRKPVASAEQVQKEPIDRLKKIFGGSLRIRITKRKSNEQDRFVWTAHGGRAIGVMLTLFCLMSLKRKTQIKKALYKWRDSRRHLKEIDPPNPQLALQF